MSNLGNYNLSKDELKEMGFEPLDGLVYIPYRRLGTLKYYEINRDLDKVRLKRLKETFNKYGKYNTPLIINELGYIIDGQHRVKEAEIAGEGTYAVVISNVDERAVIALNQTNSSWSLKEYIMAYKVEGSESYALLLDLINDYPCFTITFLATVCQKNVIPFKTVQKKELIEGNFKVEASEQNIRYVLNKMNQIYVYLKKDKFTHGNFPTKLAQAILWALKDETVNKNINDEDLVKSFVKLKRLVALTYPKEEANYLPKNNDDTIELLNQCYGSFCNEETPFDISKAYKTATRKNTK